MAQPEPITDDTDPARAIHPDLPNHVATDAELIAAVQEGLADIEAGRTVPFETVAAELRRMIHGKA
jgi:predicted transcriptional regulator